MSHAIRTLAAALATVLVAAGADVQARPSGGGARFAQHGNHSHPAGHPRGHRLHRHSHWGLGLGFTFVPFASPHPWGPGYAVEPPPFAYERRSVPPLPATPPAPAPVFMPQGGQDATQTEVDRRACDREAMTQPSAMAAAPVFHRTVLACMQARGYAVK
jgi:hypothetical protein